MKHSVICIVNENTEEYNEKNSENDVQYCHFNMGENDKIRELNPREGDNSSQYEGKTVAWEHTIPLMAYLHFDFLCPMRVQKIHLHFVYMWYATALSLKIHSPYFPELFVSFLRKKQINIL